MGKRLTEIERQYRQLSEKQFQTQVIDLARVYGWKVCHFSDSRKQVRPGVFVGDKDASGFPDLVLVRPPEIMFWELKKELGKTKPDQDEWIGLLQACGMEARVVRPSDWDYLQKRLS